MTDMTFGIEIECYLPANKIAELGLMIGGHFASQRVQNPNLLPTGWTAGYDGSLSHTWRDAETGVYPINGWNRRGIEYQGVEFVSPPLIVNAKGIGEVAAVMKLIKAWGGVIDETCGSHVHIGAREFWDNADITLDKAANWAQRVVEITAALEDGIWSYSGGNARKRNSYCVSAKKYVGWNARRVVNDNDRYVAVNLLNLLNRKMTIEFRLFAGTLDAKVAEANIRNAIRICIIAMKKDGVSKVTEIVGISPTSVKDLQMQLWGKERWNLTYAR